MSEHCRAERQSQLRRAESRLQDLQCVVDVTPFPDGAVREEPSLEVLVRNDGVPPSVHEILADCSLTSHPQPPHGEFEHVVLTA